MRYWIGLCAAFALACTSPALSQARDATLAADRLFGTMAADRPGAVVLVKRGDTTLYLKAFGGADLEQGIAITPNTRFHVASVSKQFTALAVALLAKEGRIDLNADVRTYLPELPDLGARINVVDLLHHTSGLRDQWDLLTLSGTNIQSLLTQDAILALVRAQRELSFPPRTEFRYSNTGYSLAAEIVARASGMSFREFVKQRIFDPLKMTDSLIYDDASQIVSGRAQSYAVTRTGGVELRRLNFSNYGATSMITTAADLHKWSRELLHPQIFDTSLIHSMQVPARLTGGNPSNYGLGVYKATIRGREAVMHTGSDAGYRALIATYAADGLSIVILSNGSADLLPIHEALVGIFGTGAVAPQADFVPDAQTLASLAGYYASGWGAGMELRVDGGQLVRVAGGAPGPATFKVDGTIELSLPLTRFRIVRAATGQVTALEELSLVGPIIRYDRVEKRPIGIDELRAVAGKYRSEELDITYTLAMTGNGLTMSNLQSPEPRPLKPVRPGWFDTASGRITILRGADGKPTAFLLTAGRSRNIRFDRIAEPNRLVRSEEPTAGTN